MQYIRLKNWSEYQHYKDRSAPWIKLHKEMLSSRFWVMGSDASKVLAICLMLLAQRNDNKIPLDEEYIRRFGHLETRPDFSELANAQFIEIIDENDCLQDASAALATCPPEERERESRGEEKKHTPAARKRAAVSCPDDVSESVWTDYLAIRKAKRAPMTGTALDGLRKEAGKAGLSLQDALRVCCAKGWQGFDASWIAGRAGGQSRRDKDAAWLDELLGKNSSSRTIEVNP